MGLALYWPAILGIWCKRMLRVVVLRRCEPEALPLNGAVRAGMTVDAHKGPSCDMTAQYELQRGRSYKVLVLEIPV